MVQATSKSVRNARRRFFSDPCHLSPFTPVKTFKSSEASPSLTVYIPAFNVAPFISQAIRSILNQTYRDFELLVVDDGSTDRTLEIVNALAAEDQRIRVLTQSHEGVSVASNRAINTARAGFVARMDGDDIADFRRLEKQVRFLHSNADCVAVGSAILLIDEEGLPLYPMPHIEYGHRQIDKALMNGGWPIAQPSCMYRKRAILSVGGYRGDLSLHEDHDLFLRLAERGTLANLPEILQHYRQRRSSMTFQASVPGECRSMTAILQHARIRRGLPDMTSPVVCPRSLSELERGRQWGWRSLKAGNFITARKYAKQTLRKAPMSLESWRLLYCAIRGY